MRRPLSCDFCCFHTIHLQKSNIFRNLSLYLNSEHNLNKLFIIFKFLRYFPIHKHAQVCIEHFSYNRLINLFSCSAVAPAARLLAESFAAPPHSPAPPKRAISAGQR